MTRKEQLQLESIDRSLCDAEIALQRCVSITNDNESVILHSLGKVIYDLRRVIDVVKEHDHH